MKEHEQKLTLSVDIFYPDHEPRTESALFARTKHHLVKVLDTPCWICGSKDQREVHHFHAEWADAGIPPPRRTLPIGMMFLSEVLHGT